MVFIKYFPKRIDFKIIFWIFLLKRPTNSAQITVNVVKKRLRFARYYSSQTKISLPMVKRYFDKLNENQNPNPIKTDNNIIIDGHHRYVAGILFGREPETIPSFSTSATIVLQWKN